MAQSVCKLYPQLLSRLPKKRRTWESEHYSLALFVAAALGITFLEAQSTASMASGKTK
ncbi:hypothetical protein [Maricaulis sp.]|uniref:hypothetical protein n=1 Tax=Maricaulis sp. TaxID=1486257 RepID=UPI003A95AF21